MTSPLDAVYEKYKHLDGPLSDPELCQSGDGAAIYGIAGELWRAVKEARENPCEENGCTDTDNCDEICQHSRIYSPVQMQQAVAQATAAENTRVLETLDKFYDNIKVAHRHDTSNYGEGLLSFLWCVARDLTEEDWRSKSANDSAIAALAPALALAALAALAIALALAALALDALALAALALDALALAIALAIVFAVDPVSEITVWYYIFRFPGAVWNHYTKKVE